MVLHMFLLQEREERKKRMRYDKPTHNSQPVFRDQYYQNRNTKAYDRYKIPQGDISILN